MASFQLRNASNELGARDISAAEEPVPQSFLFGLLDDKFDIGPQATRPTDDVAARRGNEVSAKSLLLLGFDEP